VVDLGAADAAGVGGDAVVRFLGGTRAQVPDNYAMASPAALLPLGVPQVLIHGQADTTVPATMSEAYATAARAAGDDARFIGLPGIGHREVIDPRSGAWEQAVVELESTFNH
jgi:pimeloyl-ACP methyl ester carboxylesterase